MIINSIEPPKLRASLCCLWNTLFLYRKDWKVLKKEKKKQEEEKKKSDGTKMI